MTHWLSSDEFDALFGAFETSAWHLETRHEYRIEEEEAAYRRFLAGQPVGTEWFEPWLARVRALTASGRRIERVRVMSDPPTAYQRFELWGSPHNVRAGERVALLDQHAATDMGLPDYDFWLFDACRLVVSRFTDDGELISDELVTDDHEVDRHRRWWDMASGRATLFAGGDSGR